MSVNRPFLDYDKYHKARQRSFYFGDIMDIQQTAVELQKFADAHGLNVDTATIIDNMEAGDFVALNNAMDESDNRTILQLLQKYKARMSESYKYFSSTNSKKHIMESSEIISLIDNMSVSELSEAFKKSNTYGDSSMFSTQELKALCYEDITASIKANQIAKSNNTASQQQINPQTQAKMKQAQLQKGTGNMQVTVPGDQTGTNTIEPVVGVDVGATPQQTLVVTKSGNKPNQVSIFGLDDVSPVDQKNTQGQVAETKELDEEKSPGEINSELQAPKADQDVNLGGPSPLSNTEPGMGEMIHAIANIEKDEDLSGQESPMANSALNQNNDIIDQIIDFCSRMRGR